MNSAKCLISSIAYEAGFGDLSYFNPAFRQRSGTTSSGMRNAANQPSGRFESSNPASSKTGQCH